MSDESSGASKTEEPTGRRLERARSQGDVVKTLELPNFASFAGAASALVFAGNWLARNMVEALQPFIAHPDAIRLQGEGGLIVARQALLAATPVMGLVLFAAALAGTMGHLIQTGFIWAPDRLAFDISRLSPMAGFKKLFGLDGFIQFVRSLLKIFAVSIIGWFVLQPHFKDVRQMAEMDPMAMLPYAIAILTKLAFAVGIFLLALAGADWFLQRQRFMTRQRMTKEEVKEDFKQTEGDPHIKARQRAIRIQRARRRMMAAVPGATVVLMNPTHFAVALKYEEGAAEAPLCVAKGMDAVALRIREIAEAAGVPVVEDAPLARALYASVEIDEYIPLSQYEAVAKVIGFVLGARKRRAGAL